jgi:hypothetical protein
MIRILAAAHFWGIASNPLDVVVRSPFAGQREMAIATYVLPLAVAAAAVTFVIWRQHSKDIGKLTRDLEQARALAQDRERERDLAQEELFRRLY